VADSGYSLSNVNEFVGKEVGLSDWMTVTQDLINGFADVTEDRQWIHVDEAQSKEGPYGATVAHGLLILSLTYKLAVDAKALPGGASMCVNYGYDRIRFPAPVRAGSRVRCRAVLMKAEEKEAARLLLTTRYTVEIEGETKPALVADCLGLFFR
jgi:acyl dehydratase